MTYSNTKYKLNQSFKESIEILKSRLPGFHSLTTLKNHAAGKECGPCPLCGGRDRAYLNTETNRLYCTHCQPKGGDLIDWHCWIQRNDLKGLLKLHMPDFSTTSANDIKDSVNHKDDSLPSFKAFWEKGCSTQVPDLIYKLLCDARGLSRETLEPLVQSEFLKSKIHGGKQAVMIPYFSLQGDAVPAIQGLTVDGSSFPFTEKSGKPANKVFLKGSKPGVDCFFQVGKDISKTKILIICESAINNLTAYQFFPDACCIGLGGSTYVQKLNALKPYIDGLEQIIVAQDNDAAGDKLVVESRKILGEKVFSIQWNHKGMPGENEKDPDGFDINDLLKTGQGERIVQLVRNAHPVNLAEVPDQRTEELTQAPLPLERKTEESAPFPLDALGPILGGAAKSMLDVIQAPDAICAHSVMGFAAHTVQGHANIIMDGRIIPTNIFLLSVGDRSARKSECDKQAGRVHKEQQKTSIEQYWADYAEYKDAKDVYEKARKAIVDNKKKSMPEKNQELEKLRKEMPQGSYEPIEVFSDPTVEGIHNLFLNGTPSKFLCADEGGQVSGGHSMSQEKKLYSATTYSKWWDAAPIDRIRGGDGASILYGRRLSVHLMMQGAIAGDFFNDDLMRNQGLMSRFLAAYPTPLTGNRKYKAVDISTVSGMVNYHKQLQENLEYLLPLKVDQSGMELNELEPRNIPLDDDDGAKQLWIQAYEDIESSSGRGRMFESIEGFSGKASNHILRLAGILALFDDLQRPSIPKPYVDQAITLIEYYLNERIRIMTMAAPDVDFPLCQDRCRLN